VQDDQVELRDAAHLLGKDTWETQEAIQADLGLAGHALSVYSIGPAGERLVRFAAIQGDYGHVASKNGCGAVMGAKRLKAVAVVRGSRRARCPSRTTPPTWRRPGRTWRNGKRRACERGSTIADTSATPAACITATCR
jgi:aldehyde:ferredoxin oxidoreductase